jgi:hypothetical protein
LNAAPASPRCGRAWSNARGLALAALGALLGAPWSACQAGALGFCAQPPALTAAEQDKLLRFADIVKTELEKSGQGLALIARSGLDLSRFGTRYSHSGISLKASPNAPWSVRQLYYACDERRPRIFDQGMSGFLLGTDDPSVGYASVVFLPPAPAAGLERAALDSRQALRLLGQTYSANAYPFALLYQNCNQWLVELLALAWGGLDGADDPRAQAQRWLQDRGYLPTRFDVGNPALMLVGGFIPWLHDDDHPPEDIRQMIYTVSMPASIEAFVRSNVPGATRTEFCHTDRYVVIRHGWEAIAEGCQPGEHDTVIALE